MRALTATSRTEYAAAAAEGMWDNGSFHPYFTGSHSMSADLPQLFLARHGDRWCPRFVAQLGVLLLLFPDALAALLAYLHDLAFGQLLLRLR